MAEAEAVPITDLQVVVRLICEYHPELFLDLASWLPEVVVERAAKFAILLVRTVDQVGSMESMGLGVTSGEVPHSPHQGHGGATQIVVNTECLMLAALGADLAVAVGTLGEVEEVAAVEAVARVLSTGPSPLTPFMSQELGVGMDFFRSLISMCRVTSSQQALSSRLPFHQIEM